MRHAGDAEENGHRRRGHGQEGGRRGKELPGERARQRAPGRRQPLPRRALAQLRAHGVDRGEQDEDVEERREEGHEDVGDVVELGVEEGVDVGPHRLEPHARRSPPSLPPRAGGAA